MQIIAKLTGFSIIITKRKMTTAITNKIKHAKKKTPTASLNYSHNGLLYL